MPFALAACGYSLAGRGANLPDYIKVIAVPQFANHTSTFDIDRRLTAAVVAELSSRGRFKVISDTNGTFDAVITGVINAVTPTPTAFTSSNQASRYAITVSANIEFKDVQANKVLWSNPALQFRDEFDVTATTVGVGADPSTFLSQNADALTRLARKFAQSVVTSILEAF